jgi:fructokinase
MIACYGEALIDLIVSPYSRVELRTNSQACLGGSVFNFCLAVQRQGMQALYLNALSGDLFGLQFAKVLSKEGVKLDSVGSPAPTSIAVVQLDEAGKATYVFHRSGVADTARSAHEIIANWPAQVSVLHTGCLMLLPDAQQQTDRILAHASTSGCVLSVDANLRMALTTDIAAYVAGVVRACAMAHVVKVSEDDLVALGWLPASEAGSVQACIRAAQGMFNASSKTGLVALTLGARGACLLTREACLEQAVAHGVVVADTVGAGDHFAAALLAYLASRAVLNVASLQSGLPTELLRDALAHASAAAAISVQRVGSDPAGWDETVFAIK